MVVNTITSIWARRFGKRAYSKEASKIFWPAYVDKGVEDAKKYDSPNLKIQILVLLSSPNPFPHEKAKKRVMIILSCFKPFKL